MTETEERADLRAKLQAIADFERSTTQLRFQTLSLFLATVGLIVGLGPQSRRVGILLLLVTIGLWVLDLRNRALLWTARNSGRDVEARMNEFNSGSGGVFIDNPTGRLSTTRFGVLNWQGPLNGPLASLISYQVGIDVVFFGVMGYGVLLLIGRHGWFTLVVLAPLAVAAASAAVGRMTETAIPK